MATWQPGDAWKFVGKTLDGRSYTEERAVNRTGAVAGVPVYVLDTTISGKKAQANLTRAGLNPVNGTGFITELLRFPLVEGKNWTFGWEERTSVSANQTNGTVVESLHGDVEVLGNGTRSGIAGAFETWHVRANLTQSLGELTWWMVLDYWYAPEAKAVVRLDSRTDDGREAWSEMMRVQLADA